MMNDWKEFFKDKRVTLMGLGLLGRGLGDAIFLAEHGADLIITDMRDEKILAPSLAKLKKYKNIHYTLGGHKLEDFSARGGQAPPDFILKAAGVALNSPYIAEAKRNGIPIEMDASLFAKLMPKGVIIVGVTGTRGKSTTTALIYDILREALGKKALGARKVYKGGNLVPEATLPLLEKVKTGDIVVLELDSWQLQGFHDAEISPQVAVFTTFLDDHLLYYKGDTDRYFEDKVASFKYQKQDDLLITGKRVSELIGRSEVLVTGNLFIAKKEDVPTDWNIPLLGEHNLENIAYALKVAEHFKISATIVQKAVESFKAIPGRLEYLRTVRGVKIYNDNSATTPDATIAGLHALSSLNSSFPKGGARRAEDLKNPSTRKNAVLPLKKGELRSIILIMGGTDKGLDMSKLVEKIPKHCKAVVFLKETGTEKLLIACNAKHVTIEIEKYKTLHATRYTLHNTPLYEMKTLADCVKQAMNIAQSGDTILFSPAFASFGKWFKNEYDRGEQFIKIVNSLN